MRGDRPETIHALIRSRASLEPLSFPPRKAEMEGGCGVIGIAASIPIPGRHLLQALIQMRNRGNGKGGGIAAVGLDPDQLGVSRQILEQDYLLAIAYLDPRARDEVEKQHIFSVFEVDHIREVPHIPDYREIPGLEVRPPEVVQYFVRVRSEVLESFSQKNGLAALPQDAVADEIVYQNSYRLNRSFYASTGEKRAFVLSHGINLMVLKMVGYGDDVIRYYQLEDLRAYVWIGHHRYPTKGKVWHPGGAHPFVGLHEALVHNGDFANYASVAEYLAQRNIYPLFLTDTEVSVLVFDLLHRVYGYPLEYVIEALAPTTERDFTQLPEEKQRIYRMIQAVHIHGSPDGPWFFLIAQSLPGRGGRPPVYRLIGITDTSMLRPQVFALQEGEVGIGLAASEKQAIDAALESLAAEDPRIWPRADLYWNARGGSHTDGGAFLFTVRPVGEGTAELICTDKFGRPIHIEEPAPPWIPARWSFPKSFPIPDVAPEALFDWFRDRVQMWGYEELQGFLAAVAKMGRGSDPDRARALNVLTLILDRRYPTGNLRRSVLLSLTDTAFAGVIQAIREAPSPGYAFFDPQAPLGVPSAPDQVAVVDARGFPPEGPNSLALAIVRLYRQGFRRFLIAHTRGHRFIANGLGARTHGVRIDVYGSPGDYLASGIDGAEVYVHATAQDQLAQIMKDGKLVIYGDVGQTFGYAAKGGEMYILGNAAGRPMINAVGRPRVVINGTCLDYLAESFMAGDPLNGGGFVILNGIRFNAGGEIVDLPTPYPGGNLFSLASGGALYVRDPYRLLTEDQLNGGEFAELTEEDWRVILPYLEENERLFGIPVERLLTVEGKLLSPLEVYRKVRPAPVRALQAEEAWVHRKA